MVTGEVQESSVKILQLYAKSCDHRRKKPHFFNGSNQRKHLFIFVLFPFFPNKGKFNIFELALQEYYITESFCVTGALPLKLTFEKCLI